ncbi:hypothetical protein L226DRAFT_470621 [Lentinus tigrinus ALCF2SS1-7]|uniref:RING-type E3 ubiquitin transferase n=1 Tax=Lentinus tigrinus ALCF2SS1-6 TaxID=1328759 RepID=A0A5C2RX25_9APHY|nr:hypothetical protein L227DRAFT_510413 [Lentinus tigrinus ALCF2SS1-6]RPD70146.1 hypothetical protein L226DRAFT_470621 [Lentinus tigrinus ALCF2SS1-7]
MTSPPTKRIKLELESSPPPELQSGDITELEDSDAEHCSICLQPYADRTMIPTCSHEFCFECLLIWTEQSRRCPLCSQDVGKYLMHHIRSKYDYQKHYLPPLRTSPQPESPAVIQANARQRVARRREILWGQRRRRELEEADELERAIEKRRWVYRHRLYAKHVASNPYTRYRPFPTPAQFAASQDSISRATVFIRRELRVWSELDVEFLTTFMVSLMKSLDIRSEPAVRLLSEFLDMDAEGGHERANAEHFAHELYCYLRSPYRDLSAYDKNVQVRYSCPALGPIAAVFMANNSTMHRPMFQCRTLLSGSADGGTQALGPGPVREHALETILQDILRLPDVDRTQDRNLPPRETVPRPCALSAKKQRISELEMKIGTNIVSDAASDPGRIRQTA